MVLKIIEEVAATASKNKKLEILKTHKDNDLLKRVIQMTYDPFLQFFIRKIPNYKAEKIGTQSIHQGLDQLETLSAREVTGNAAIERLKQILESQDTDNAIIIERIIGKDLRAGFSAGTANKVWGKNFIFEWPVMLCSTFEQSLVDKMTWPAYFQLKADGMRFNAIVADGKVKYFSRNGKPLVMSETLTEEFIKLANGDRLIFDGELLITADDSVLTRQTGNGKVMSMISSNQKLDELNLEICQLEQQLKNLNK